MTPRSTLRLQLTREFTFDDARKRVGYFAALGISHLYLSPIFRARDGSMHGYDTVDFSHVSDALGVARVRSDERRAGVRLEHVLEGVDEPAELVDPP